MTPRYEGKPLLRLLELYVLDTIGELSPIYRDILEQTNPKLQAITKLDGDWRSIISQAMDFPGAPLDDSIRSLWESNSELASQHGEHLLPEDFARMIVDENFDSGRHGHFMA